MTRAVLTSLLVIFSVKMHFLILSFAILLCMQVIWQSHFSLCYLLTLSSTSAVWHAARRPWSFDGQLHQCEGGSCRAAGQICAQQTPTHWAVLWHAHREDTGKFPNQTHCKHIIVLWGLTIPSWPVHIIMYAENLTKLEYWPSMEWALFAAMLWYAVSSSHCQW